MKLAILGTGMVGQTNGTKLVKLGHQVMMGSRSADNEAARNWVRQAGNHALQGTFQEAAQFGEMIFNCTKGMSTLDALKMAGAENLAGKILVDISNPLDFSQGMPPSLSVCNTDSLGEQIQRAFPKTKVVKTLNTLNCELQVNPALVPGEHDIFISGNDPDAKNKVVDLLRNGYGWQSIIDLGDISSARGTEQILPLWVRLFGVLGNANFNFKVVRKT